MESVALFLVLTSMAVLIAWPFLLLRRKRIDTFVNQWAKENNYELIKYQERVFSPFTFSRSRSKNQEVVFVEIKDQEGRHREGWLKLGGYFSGLFSYKAECKWKSL